VNHSDGCLRNWCDTAKVRPKQFRDFTRALRAVHLLAANPAWLEANVLDTVDPRTLEKFRVKCGGTSDRLRGRSRPSWRSRRSSRIAISLRPSRPNCRVHVREVRQGSPCRAIPQLLSSRPRRGAHEHA
jgi:hypothetical protein